MGMAVFASKEYENAEKGPQFEDKITENSIVVKIEENEYFKTKLTSDYIGLIYRHPKWYVSRWSKKEKKMVHNGGYDDEETAAHASDTLARKLMNNGEQGHKLNFPDDDTEVHKKTATSQYIGVTYSAFWKKWHVQRKSKNEKKLVHNGGYDNEKTAAHASDTLARELTEKGEHGHKLNFPDDHTEVHPEKAATSEYIGVTYIHGQKHSKWRAQRYSRNEKKIVFYGNHDNEKTAAHTSDTLARKLTHNGEQGHKLNFPNDDTKVHKEYLKKKRKRQQNYKDN